MLSESEIRGRVLDLFKESGMTQSEAAAKAEIQPSTLSRYLAGESKNPFFLSLCSLIMTLGGSVDRIIGNVHDEEKQEEPQKEIIVRTDEKYVEQIIEDLKYERKCKQIAIIAIAVLAAAFIAFLIFDATHPEIGYIKYGDGVMRYYVEEEAAHLLTLEGI